MLWYILIIITENERVMRGNVQKLMSCRLKRVILIGLFFALFLHGIAIRYRNCATYKYDYV